MASKSLQQEPEKLDVQEALEVIDKTLDRVKSLYEQYFLGIQKQPPTFLHTDLERKLRDLGQIQIRNTALRYRFVTVQQKFGSYHAYWRRTLRQIENGRYVRSLHKLSRKAAQTGEEIPEEILAAMPKRMRDQVRRDREVALANARRRDQLPVSEEGGGDFYDEYDQPPPPVARVDARGAHVLDEADADLDLDAYFQMVADETAEPTHSSAPPQPPAPDELDEPFENIVTPPRATPSPTTPAPHRAATLGFGPRPTTSPSLRAQNAPNRTATDPGAPVPTPPPFAPVGPSHTPPSFRPTPTPPASRPAFRAVDTVPGTAPVPPNRTATEPGTPAPAVRPSANVISRPGAQPVAATRPSANAIPPTPTSVIPRVVPPTPPAGTSVIPRVVPPIPAQPTGPRLPPVSQPIPRIAGALPPIPQPKRSQPMTEPDQLVVGARPLGRPAADPHIAPSQITRPNPIAAGAAATVKPATVETLAGPFAREPSVAVPPRRTKRDTDIDQSGGVDVPMEPTPRPTEPVRPAATRPVSPARPTTTPGRPVAPSASRPNQAVAGRTGSSPAMPPARRPPPPGMTDDDVNNLYAKYVKAKEMVGETTGPQTYGKLLNTINAQAPKIMEQYKAKGVDFSVVVKDNQVIIRAKPKP